ncbi:pilus assembly protein PilP [Wohlfahrtiimonas larvae]|uniref:Pilus assembly protein PilP n=1 Tax=Wohlfahrtiimonas larvae TaxID=1157986 RepID=A0ABP9MMP0_9GAMM|nr:pilus assembly protein PilP [Wohlfahrtiimonas larvae]
MNKKMIMSILLVSATLQGCMEQFERSIPVEERIMETKQGVTQRVKTIKIESVANQISLGDTSLFYLQQGRDPFVATGFFKGLFNYGDFNVVSNSKVRLKEDPSRPKGYRPGPFEKYELNGLTMIGVMSLANGETAALIDVGQNKIMMLKKGDYVGRDFGEVTEITERSVLIDEKFGSTNREDGNAWIVLPNKIDLKIK